MSLLTPLFAVAGLAVALPLIFHLIQRRPRGQMSFSSLMFLVPSAPRLTRRNRLENLLLLLLRALALILLSVAFTRPFMRSLADLDTQAPARRVLLLVDTSASMQRDGLWGQALRHADDVLNGLGPSDTVALSIFDSSTRPVVGFEDWSKLPSSQRALKLREGLKHVTPTWASTNLGQALTAACDTLQTPSENFADTGELPGQIVLVSDLQTGAKLDALNGYQWPAQVQVDIRCVRPNKTTNARAVILTDQAAADATAAGFRVRVDNARSSVGQQFRLAWANRLGELGEEREYRIQVPSGTSQVISLAPPASTAERLLLMGDDDSFDNVVYFAQPKKAQKTLLYVGRDVEDSRSSLLYYLRRASLSTARQDVELQWQQPEEPLRPLSPQRIPLVIVAAPTTPENTLHLQQYLQTGGRMLFVLGAPSDDHRPSAEYLRQLTSVESLTVEEAEGREYAMLAKLDFQHPVFKPLDDPRFRDFTKIRFWSHRRIASGEEAPWSILAGFDDRSPALIEQRFGEGRLWILTAGWQPEESQLALSTKFIPLLAGMFDPTRPPLTGSYYVGETIELPSSDTTGHLVLPDGTVQNLDNISKLDSVETPGIYRYVDGQTEIPFAVNLAVSESQTGPLDADDLERHGVSTGRALTADELQEQRRQMRDVELESRQKLWRWLIVGVLGVLAFETWLASRQSRTPFPVASAV